MFVYNKNKYRKKKLNWDLNLFITRRIQDSIFPTKLMKGYVDKGFLKISANWFLVITYLKIT